MNYRKSKNIGGFRLNFSKKGVGASLGVKGARVSLDSKGNINRTFSIPGTGLYDKKRLGNIMDMKEKNNVKEIKSSKDNYYSDNINKGTTYRSPIISAAENNLELKKTKSKGQVTFILGIVFSALAVLSLLSLFSGSLDGLGVAFFFVTVALLFFAFSKIAKKRIVFILSSVACFVISIAILGNTSNNANDLNKIKKDTTSKALGTASDIDSSEEMASNISEEPDASQKAEQPSESSTTETPSIDSSKSVVSETTQSTTKTPPVTSSKNVLPDTSQSTAKTPISITSGLSFVRNEIATVSINAQPNTEYSIKVYYPSGKSTAQGLENKTSDANGNVSWSWKIGGKTTEGAHYLIITGGGETIRKDFTVN